MIQSGKLDRVIEWYGHAASTVDDNGQRVDVWSQPAQRLRAQLKTKSLLRQQEAAGTDDGRSIILLIRHVSGMRIDDTIVFEGDQYAVKKINEIGRRRALEIECEQAS